MRPCLAFLCLFSIVACVQPDVNETATGPNSNPVITGLKAEPPATNVGEIVTLTAEAGDPDDDRLEFEWYMTAGDLVGNGSIVRYVATYCCAGINTVRVTVKDGRGGSATKVIDVAVNSP